MRAYVRVCEHIFCYRVMSSKITRVSADTTLTLDEDSDLPSVDGALAVQGLCVCACVWGGGGGGGWSNVKNLISSPRLYRSAGGGLV